MPLIAWDSKYSVGIRIVDEQHQKLIDIINSLYDAMKEGKAKNILGKLLTELISYTEYHFKTEEGFFKKHNYPEAASHKAEHDELRKEVVGLKEKFDNDEIVVSVEVLYFLKGWLANHILGADKKYSPFLSSKGLI